MSEETCGEAYEHRLMLVGERDGITTEQCLECGAEIVTGWDTDGL